MSKPRILFMGTPEFAKVILQTLIENDYHVVGLVCQPDKLAGRKRQIQFPPSKVYALDHDIPVFQPVKLTKEFAFVEQLSPDLIITCAYGQFVPQKMLDIPPLGCINLHASLLPLLRGGAPIQHAILQDFKETGITLMQMIKKMDAGLMYAKVKVNIDDNDTYDSLVVKLFACGKQIIKEYLPQYLNNELVGIPQMEEEATFGYNISREEEKIDFFKPARVVYNHIRGLCSIPGAYALFDELNVKIYQSTIVEAPKNIIPGTIYKIEKDGICVKCLDEGIKIKRFQLPGKGIVNVKDYLNGKSIFALHKQFY